MSEIPKIDIRKIWVIQILSNGKQKSQQEILHELNGIGNDIIARSIEMIEEEILKAYSEEELDFFDKPYWEKSYNITVDELEEAFHYGKQGDFDLIDLMLEDMEGIDSNDLTELNLDDYPSEIKYLVELRGFYKNKKKITDPTVSTILKKLRDENIIETVPGKTQGRGPSPNFHSLKKDLNALRKILRILNTPKLSIFYSKELSSLFMKSEYFKELINEDIIKKLETKLEDSFTVEEKNIVLKIIRISPKAIFTVLEYLKSPSSINQYSGPTLYHRIGRKKSLLFNLEIMLGDDIGYLDTTNVEFKVIVSFNEESVHDTLLGQKVEKSRICSILSPIQEKKWYGSFKDYPQYSPI